MLLISKFWHSYTNPDIPQKAHPKSAKHTFNVGHIPTGSLQVKSFKITNRSVLPHCLTPSSLNAISRLVSVCISSIASYAKRTINKTLHTSATSAPRLSVSPHRQQQNCTKTYLIPPQTQLLASYCPNHTREQPTSHPPANSRRTKRSIQHISHFRSLSLFLSPTKNLYTYRTIFSKPFGLLIVPQPYL